ncbi:hypothetical protein [Nocardioides marmorisolisilvae]|uniref:DUF3153 domain-containing protein n=1 Tax=Nocardioides marmorisolisilvae TaxID=1542737 RepID=A0A3N0DZS8_9ACTN|nr:hypothetical protein [Nocardioides marmorisolisilvae]RNL81097.1 hypothetical protein EFL95_01585 [Nocardioides marmorisolisilvae]
MIRRLLVGAVLLPLGALLVGCQAGSDIVVQPDGSGTYSTIVTVDGPAGDALYTSAVKAAEKSGVPLKVAHYTSGTESGAKITCAFRSLDDLAAMATKLSGADTGLGGVKVSRGEDGWTFVATPDGGLNRPAGSTETGSTGGDIDAGKLGGLIHMSVQVELPGSPGVTNATAVTNTATTSTFRWNLEVGREASDLQAATHFVGDQGSVELATDLTPLGSHAGDDGGWPTWAWVALAVGLLVLLALALLVLKRRRTAPDPEVPVAEDPDLST